jgi:hypothetical protein
MDFRASYGDLWRTTNIEYTAKLGLAKNPQKLKSSGIKRLIERAPWEQGIREPLQWTKAARMEGKPWFQKNV